MNLKQQKDGWCGPAALSFALLRQGKYCTQEEIAKSTGTTESKGVDPAPLTSYVKSKGFTPKDIKESEPNKRLNVMDHFVKQGKSVVVDYLADGDYESGHYVVFQGLQGNKVSFWDPESGKIETMNTKEFIKDWKDKTEGGRVFKYWALVF